MYGMRVWLLWLCVLVVVTPVFLAGDTECAVVWRPVIALSGEVAVAPEVEIMSFAVGGAAQEWIRIVNFNNKVAGAAEEAHNAEEMADAYFDEGDYEEAEKYYEKAKSLYQQSDDDKKAQEMGLKAERCRGHLEYDAAEWLYEQKEYRKALEAYERAREYFVMVDDKDMMASIESRLEEVRAVVEESENQKGNVGVFLVLIVFLGIVVYLWKFRGRGREEVEEETAFLPEREELEEDTLPLPEREELGEDTLPLPEREELEEDTLFLPEREELEEDTLFLPKEPQLVCPICNKRIDKNWVSCPYCGANLIDT